MLKRLKPATLLLALVSSTLLLQGCGGCGFECGSDEPITLSLGISTTPANNSISSVFIDIDSIEFRRNGSDNNVLIETFTVDSGDIDITDEETLQINLLDYRGTNQLMAISDISVDPGTYTDIVITLSDSSDDSYVEYMDDDNGDLIKPLVVTNNTLTLDGFIATSDNKTFTIKLSLLQSLYENDDNFQLTTKGQRVLDNANDVALVGSVDSDLFDQISPCDVKDDREQGNRLYLYQGNGLVQNRLADVYTTDSTNTIPNNTISPYDVILPSENIDQGTWQYSIGFLPTGNYTLAFTCDAETDDPIEYEGLSIPLPTAQLYELQLNQTDTTTTCNLSADATGC